LRIVRVLLEERLIACGNVLDGVSSLFWWAGRVDEAGEALAVMKSHSSLFGRLCSRISELHSYAVPEVLAVPVVAGSERYLEWLKESLELGKTG